MKFSVAMCTYNGERFIAEQLKSILCQTRPVDQIVICDDCSRDNTLAIAEGILKDSGIAYQILINDPPLGVADNFLKALKQADGDYVFTCDQDDIWHPDKVQIFADAIEREQKALFFSDGILVDGSGKPLGSTLWQAYGFHRELHAGGSLLHGLLKRPMVTGAAMAVSRGLIAQIDRIPEHWLHDEWFSLIAALQDSAVPICRPTFDYRQHGNNVVGAKKRTLFEKIGLWFAVIQKLKPFRQEHFQKKTDMLTAAAGTGYQQLVADARDFWGNLHQMAEKNVFARLRVVFQLFRKGQYSIFYTGSRGFVRDLISCFFR